MIDLDALKAELEAAGLTVVRDEDDGTITATRNYGAGHIADIHVRPDGRVSMSGYAQNGRAFADMPVDRRMFDALAIIARHVVPVVTPEPDAEARDVLAEAIERCDRGEDDCPDCPPTSHQMADAGLAALRARGFAVVRTADLKGVLATQFPSRWPVGAEQRFREAIR